VRLLLLAVVPVEGCLVDFVDRVRGIDIDVMTIERRLLGFDHGVGGVDGDVMTIERSLFVTAPCAVRGVDVDVVTGEVGRSPW